MANSQGNLSCGTLAFIIIGGIVVFQCFQSCGKDTSSQSTSPSTPVSSTPAVKPDYTLLSSDDCTVDVSEPCRRVKIAVPKGRSKPEIASDLTDATQKAASENGAARGIAFAYAEGTDTGGGYSAGRALWGTNEGTDTVHTADAPAIDYTDDYFQQEKPASSSVAGMPESRRREIAYQMAEYEDRARSAAEEKYPIDKNDTDEEMAQFRQNIQPNGNLRNRLEERYHARIRRKYHLTQKQFDDIMTEALEKRWPLPAIN